MELNIERDMKIKFIDEIIKATNTKKLSNDNDKEQLFTKFYDFFINVVKSNSNYDIVEKVNRDINIYIDRKCFKMTLESLAKKYNISRSRIGAIPGDIQRRFRAFYGFDNTTIGGIGLDTRTLRALLYSKIKSDNGSYYYPFTFDTHIDKLYDFDIWFYLNQCALSVKSIEKLNKTLVRNGYSKIG